MIYSVLALSIISTTAMFSSRVALTLYTLSLGAQPATVGLLAATFAVFPMLLAVTAGRLADRFGPRWILLFGAVSSGLGMLVPFFLPGLPAIFIAGAMIGLSSVFYNVTTQNLVGMLSEPHNRAANFSNYSLTNSASELAGPLIAGFSIEHAGYDHTCLYIALLTVVLIALLVFRGGGLPKGAPNKADRAPGGVRSMLMAPGVRKVLITGSLQNVGTNLYQFYLPVYARAVGLSPSVIGIVLATYSAAAFVVRAVLSRLIVKWGEERVLSHAFFVGAASLTLIPFFKGVVMLCLISFLFGLGMGCCQPIVTMLMFVGSPAGRSGEALGLKVTINQATKIVSPMLFGVIASVFGLPPIFWLNALLLGGGGLISRSRKQRITASR